MFYIWSVEHTAWWKPGRSGYTPTLDAAGLYDESTARRIVEDANLPLANGRGFRYVHEVMIPADAVRG